VETAKNVHVVFGVYSKNSLERSFPVAAHLAGEVFSLGDDLRVGPVTALNTFEGLSERKKWFASIDDEYLARNFETEGVNDQATIEAIKQLLLKGHFVHIWFGNYSFDILSLGRLLESIQGFAKQLILVPVSESTQVSLRQEVFVPKILGVLRNEQIPSLEKHFRALTDLDLKTFSTIWSTASLRAESLKMVDAKGIFQENVVDKINQMLIFFCMAEYQKSARIIGESLVALEFEVSDATLNWMLKTLVITGQLEARGTLRMMKDYEVRLL